jgi:hypothetical protein
MVGSVSISKPHPSNRRDRRVVWGIFAGLQVLCTVVAVETVGTEAGLTLALLETGLTGGVLTLWLREPVRPGTGPRAPERGGARAGTGGSGRVWLFLTLATLVGFPAGVALALALGGAFGWQGADRLLGVMLLAPVIWSGLCFAVLWRVLPGRSRRGPTHV